MFFQRLLAGLVALLALHATAWASANGVVISQVYGGGGNSGATLRNDFIELFNGGSAPVSLAGWSVQYASTTGGSWQKTDLTGVTLQPGQYYLVQQAQGTGGTQNLPTPDATGTIPMAAGAGKVALVNHQTLLTGSAPSGSAIIDFVGYGPGTNAFEGAPTTSNLSATTAALRAANGCTDTDNNASDFATGTPAPRNGASPLAPCGGVNQPISFSCPAANAVAGTASTMTVSASDVDGVVNGASVVGTWPEGFTPGGFTAAVADGGTATQQISVASNVAAGSYSLPLLWSNNEAQTVQCTIAVTVSGITPIPAIQGNGASSPLAGQGVTTRGVVTKLNNNGYFLQDPVGDGDPMTSDGIFVFTSSAPTVVLGQLVQISGTVTEFNTGAAGNADTAAHPVTELTATSGLQVLGSGYAIAPTPVTLPEVVNDELERFEGMLVTLQGPLTVAQNYFVGRFGQLTLAAGGRLETPTNRHRPGADALALADENARRRIVLDDGTTLQNPNPTPYFAADNTVRAGDTTESVTGVVDYGLATSSNTGFGDYKIHPTVAPTFTRVNQRTTAPAPVGGNVKVASANVLNYFTTLNNGSNVCPPSNTADDCRGANSSTEFTRQCTKIVESLAAIDADVVGLMEMQNNGATAVQNLVDALNAKVGAGTYARVPDPATGTGTDAIKVAMIYKPGRLLLPMASTSDTNAIHDRPPLAQVFTAPNGERFVVVVNHFKSKGCDGAAGADLDQGDLQGCFNARRAQQAQALRSFIQSVQAQAATNDVLVIGDLNAYAHEDPVFDLTSAGFVDEIGRYNTLGYSYVFDGAAGRLDHALSSLPLSSKVTGAIEWHINGDEPSVIDYNLEFKQPACATCGPDYYTATPYRSSDHDPVVIGLSIYKHIDGTAGRDTLVGTAGDDVITGGDGADTLTGGTGRDVFAYLTMRDAGDAITDFVPGTDRLDLTALLASIGVQPQVALSRGIVRLVAGGGGTLVQIDTDGMAGAGTPRTLVTLRGVSPAQIVASRDLGL